MRRNICLIGYMGSGKSSVGRLIAARRGMRFADTDEMIVEREGRSIPRIFEESGEPCFRALEYELMLSLSSDEAFENTVLATGGGLPMSEANRPLLKRTGTVIYLRAGADTLYERVGSDTGRPLLNTDDRLKKIEQMLRVRGPVYEEVADHIIDTDGMSKEDVAEKVLEIYSALV